MVAPLWVAYEANLGTLLRTCDAVGACMAVPATPHNMVGIGASLNVAVAGSLGLPSNSLLSWLADDRADEDCRAPDWLVQLMACCRQEQIARQDRNQHVRVEDSLHRS